MILDPTSAYAGHILLLENMDEESKARLRADAEAVYGTPWALALKDFFALSKGDLSYLGLTTETAEQASIRQYIWMLYFKEVCEQVAVILKKLVVPQTAEQEMASKSCLKMGFEESTLIFVRKYFALHNFTEAENITLSDFLIAKKDSFNGAIYQKAMNDIQRQKFKRKK